MYRDDPHDRGTDARTTDRRRRPHPAVSLAVAAAVPAAVVALLWALAHPAALAATVALAVAAAVARRAARRVGGSTDVDATDEAGNGRPASAD